MKQTAGIRDFVPLLLLALLMLAFAGVFGFLSGLEYLFPGYLKQWISFSQLRPMHVSAVVFWILLASNAFVNMALLKMGAHSFSRLYIRVNLALWTLGLIGVFYAYANSLFGGREYWEFHPCFAIPIALAWLMFAFQLIGVIRKMNPWPVYVWMWLTGAIFFLWIFLENYFWLIIGLRDKAIVDITVQWKVNGSLVGAWNQLIYGTVFYLMDRIKGQKTIGASALAFAMYFLGLFNLMFNWGHHVYTLPGVEYVRTIGYVVSMTEWVFFVKIFYEWKKSLQEIKLYHQYQSYQFIMASNFWVMCNMGMAILMSIPALNLYTHGTHVTVAHAMGTTIGINTMILLAAAYTFAYDRVDQQSTKKQRLVFWVLQTALLVSVVALIGAGIQKGFWQMSENSISFKKMMLSLRPWFLVFLVSGFVIMINLFVLVYDLMKRFILQLKK